MKIDGKAIAERILTELAQKVTVLKGKGIVPTLVVILVGDDESSTTYIEQKQITAKRIGASLILEKYQTITPDAIGALVTKYNGDTSVHGLIVQRPLPKDLGDMSKILDMIKPTKDVDGFLTNSPFTAPVAQAVLTLLNEVFEREKPKLKEKTFDAWFKNQCSVVIGRGETAGKPIAKVLENKGCTIEIVHSGTPDPKAVTLKFNIVVSCVGKERVVTPDMVTAQTILIGVGLHRDSLGKLRGDFEEDEIKENVAYYTPTPGGVGPVNVASLMQNLVKACTMMGEKV